MHDSHGGRVGAGRSGVREASVAELPGLAADILDRLRQRRPKVHCITNAVAQAFTANMLLAAGAVPSMTVAPDEVAHFVVGADALLVNLGTFDVERRQASEIAIEAAAGRDLPWVLDPVFVDRSQPRAGYARKLVGKGPRSIRLNHGEFLALAGVEPETGALLRHARDRRIVIGLTGETDRVTDGERIVTIANGHPLMSRVTAVGCAGSALVAACLAVADDAFAATAAALITLGVAGEIAAERARGPGTLAATIVDAVYDLDCEALRARARVT